MYYEYNHNVSIFVQECDTELRSNLTEVIIIRK